ncbi:phytoene/squalene synthase family protein [Alloacidobacterium dinghuense]|uniref:Phytoene/squalene synthase family protein n=1 Tax=Alloacidobacterium dinghuense TaxID=2763107 RepID=A0A7G8BKC3_9BACT|nr:phytoene/squalene synthase family protein [Alloacidobacterium dinghuense]QNI32993.1 phytoene/squalene synthase family protein [Alloacidobacterium dinghuense]
MTVSIDEAYAICRQIARREAKNFYYAFVALPKAKRDAICAVYAFMRHADDLSDDETKSRGERRNDLDRWLATWHDAAQGKATDDPVFIALRDAQSRFHITTDLLDQLVQGTAMDLHPAHTNHHSPGSEAVHPLRFDTYATFEDLYRYCYYVASVVGLVCIRIFEYTDAHAEKLAEETGIAFQLTNILRDVREDAERDRIYLPLEDMERFGVSIDEIRKLTNGHHLTLNQRELLEFEAKRAEHYYKSGEALLPLIAADARPALWVLITIYHRLLCRIEDRNFDVFTERVSVPTTAKLAILARGLVRTLVNRLRGKS